jgi:glycosyltransferase involved in cell wall biosynthesis
MSPRTPFLSVVMCTRDRADLLRRTLESLCVQTLGREAFEIVLVDDGSSDATRETALAFQSALPLRYAYQRHAGVASARNHGVFTARGQVLLFLDDAVVADPALLEVHAEAHRRNPERRHAVVGRDVLDPALHADPLMRFVVDAGQLLCSCADPGGGQPLDFRHFCAGRTSCKRDLLVFHGVFNPAFRTSCGDIELAFRLSSRRKLRMVHAPRAVTAIASPVGYDELCASLRERGAASLLFSRLHLGDAAQRWAEVPGATDRWLRIRPAFEVVIASGRALDRVARMRQAAGLPLDPADAALLNRGYRAAFRAFRLKGLVEKAAETGQELPAALPETVVAARGTRTRPAHVADRH